jgi:hypothetical protein
MRSRKALLNSASALLLEGVTIICGFILPRLILSRFGSSYNGITSSISQFMSYIALLKSGIGGVTRASLYKPLQERNIFKISAIVNATEQFMRQIAKIFAAFILIFATLYPFLVSDEFPWLFSFTLVLILSIGTFAQYYFGITYQMLLQADQRQYISSLVQIFTTILNTIVAAILINIGGSIHIVKLGSSIVYALNPLFINIYVRKKYSINRKIPSDNTAISQRWDSFAHQIANFVHGNTDIVVLTIFSSLSEVSVYTVYAMVVTGVRKLVNTFASGVEAAFGNMLAKNEDKLLQKNLNLLEFVIFYMSAICFSATIALIIPFVMVYTKGISDVNYNRPLFGAILCMAEMFWCIRIPYQSVVLAAGKYKETRNGAIAEPIINIIVSVALVWKFGLVGVAIGTLCAMIFRTVQYAVYMSRNIVIRKINVFIFKLIVFMINVACSCQISNRIGDNDCTTYGQWVILGVERGLIIVGINIIFALVFERENMKSFISKIKTAIKI